MDTTNETAHSVIGTHIVSTPGVCGGKPRITNTRIRVQDVYVWHALRGQSPEEIVADFPQLTLADVHAALAFYYDNHNLIQRHMREPDELIQSIRGKQGPGMLERLQGRDNTDPLPP
jgi:uncharacterized protein (DUF433 family)